MAWRAWRPRRLWLATRPSEHPTPLAEAGAAPAPEDALAGGRLRRCGGAARSGGRAGCRRGGGAAEAGLPACTLCCPGKGILDLALDADRCALPGPAERPQSPSLAGIGARDQWSSTRRAIGAACCAPKPAFSTITATAMQGLSSRGERDVERMVALMFGHLRRVVLLVLLERHGLGCAVLPPLR